jgi:hypothetical protein
LNDFQMLMVLTLIALPLVYFLRTRRGAIVPPAPAMEH